MATRSWTARDVDGVDEEGGGGEEGRK